MYHQHIEDMPDTEKSYQLLEKTGLKDSTEAVIIETGTAPGVYHTDKTQDPRLCKDAPETALSSWV